MTAATFEAIDDLDAINKLYRERGWSDGLPIVPPTLERLARMLRHTPRQPDEIVARLAPAYGAATVEHIAVNAVLAGCDPEALPVLLAATEAVADARFNLQGIQATTNPVAVWVILNGPVVAHLGVIGTIEAHSREDCIEWLKQAGREATDRKVSCGIPMRSDGGESCYDAATKLEAYGERAIELCKDARR